VPISAQKRITNTPDTLSWPDKVKMNHYSPKLTTYCENDWNKNAHFNTKILYVNMYGLLAKTTSSKTKKYTYYYITKSINQPIHFDFSFISHLLLMKEKRPLEEQNHSPRKSLANERASQKVGQRTRLFTGPLFAPNRTNTATERGPSS